METVRLGTAGFPDLLSHIPNPPDPLWVRGAVSELSRPAIALVGSRAATRDGLAMASAIAADMARAGIVVVSGLARGVDSAAHTAALDAGGTTIAVLGTGIDRIYPSEHRGLADRIAAAGALVSEFIPGTPPRAFHFPMRNRIISGLSAAVVVVEAPEKSGALITAREALEQGRDVMVVPGRVAGERNRGGHRLIRDGAMLVESAADILQGLGWDTGHPATVGVPASAEFSVDDIARTMNLAPGEALAHLLEWELAGEIQRVGSGRFVRSGGRVLT